MQWVLGVSRIERPDLSTLGRPDLNVARERNMRLYDHAAPVMELLHEQIVNSDLFQQIRAAATDADPLVLIGRMKAVQKALKQLQANANLRLTMHDLVLQLAAV